mmetsp:Transcript_64617/g.114939  ORF Transcript_64617/g.114939 Transcript_64617/m.114939 type:complete len:156 (+) Transcript_64617:63-530(+)
MTAASLRVLVVAVLLVAVAAEYIRMEQNSIKLDIEARATYPQSQAAGNNCQNDPSHCVTCAGGLNSLTDFCGNSGQDNWCAGPQGQGAQCLCPHRTSMYLKEKPEHRAHFDATTCRDQDTNAAGSMSMPVTSSQLAQLKTCIASSTGNECHDIMG